MYYSVRTYPSAHNFCHWMSYIALIDRVWIIAEREANLIFFICYFINTKHIYQLLFSKMSKCAAFSSLQGAQKGNSYSLLYCSEILRHRLHKSLLCILSILHAVWNPCHSENQYCRTIIGGKKFKDQLLISCLPILFYHRVSTWILHTKSKAHNWLELPFYATWTIS